MLTNCYSEMCRNPNKSRGISSVTDVPGNSLGLEHNSSETQVEVQSIPKYWIEIVILGYIYIYIFFAFTVSSCFPLRKSVREDGRSIGEIYLQRLCLQKSNPEV